MLGTFIGAATIAALIAQYQGIQLAPFPKTVVETYVYCRDLITGLLGVNLPDTITNLITLWVSVGIAAVRGNRIYHERVRQKWLRLIDRLAKDIKDLQHTDNRTVEEEESLKKLIRWRRRFKFYISRTGIFLSDVVIFCIAPLVLPNYLWLLFLWATHDKKERGSRGWEPKLIGRMPIVLIIVSTGLMGMGLAYWHQIQSTVGL